MIMDQICEEITVVYKVVHILSLHPRAFFVPYSSHTLNLIVNDAASCCVEAVKFFDIIQRLYNFFSSSTQRWNILKKHVTGLALKPICKTRWSSQIDAVNPLRYQLEQIIEALESFLNTQESIETVTTANNKSGADLFLDEILNFKFICSLIIRHDILSNINITSKALQQEDLNIEKAKLLIDSSLKYIQDYRCDEKFKNILKEAEHIAIKLNIEKFFVKTRKRTRTQNIIFPYENQDTEIQNEDYYIKESF